MKSNKWIEYCAFAATITIVALLAWALDRSHKRAIESTPSPTYASKPIPVYKCNDGKCD